MMTTAASSAGVKEIQEGDLAPPIRKPPVKKADGRKQLLPFNPSQGS